MFVDCGFGDLFSEVDFAQNLVVDCRKIVKKLDPPLPPPHIIYRNHQMQFLPELGLGPGDGGI